jgi:hypothetical protein
MRFARITKKRLFERKKSYGHPEILIKMKTILQLTPRATFVYRFMLHFISKRNLKINNTPCDKVRRSMEPKVMDFNLMTYSYNISKNEL